MGPCTEQGIDTDSRIDFIQFELLQADDIGIDFSDECGDLVELIPSLPERVTTEKTFDIIT